MDVLEAADGGAVEADTVNEELAAQLTRRDREVLPRARQVREPQVDDGDLGIASELERLRNRTRVDGGRL